MKTNLLSILFLTVACFIINQCSAQLPYDTSKITKDKKLNFAFTDKRGISAENGIIYLVEKDLQTVSAYQSEKIKWSSNIIKVCGILSIGAPEVRYIELIGTKIFVTFGKHSFANVDISNGKTKYLGAD